MSDTTENIIIPHGVWVDLYSLAGVAVGTQIAVENVGVFDILLAVQAAQPSTTHNAFNILKRNGPPLMNNTGDAGVWAFCQNAGSKVNVMAQRQTGFLPVTSLSSIQISDPSQRVAVLSDTGEVVSAMRHDDISVNFQYGVSTYDTVDGGVSTGTGGVATSKASAELSTGAGVGDAQIVSRDSIRYRAGNTCYAHTTAVFGTPQAGVNQYVGFLNESDGWSVGYQGLDFGLWFIEGSNVNFFPQDDFNVDKLDGTGPSGFDINPQAGNAYWLSFTWHGYLDLVLEVRTSDGRWVTVHREIFVNDATETHLENPNLPITARVERESGSGDDVVLRTSSWRGGSISGHTVSNLSDRWFSHTELDVSIVSPPSNTNVFTVRNKSTYQTKLNHIAAELGVVSFVSSLNKTVSVYGTLNATLSGNGAFADIDTLNSVLEVSSGGTVSGGSRGPALVLGPGGDKRLDVRDTGIKLFPGQTFTFEVDPGSVAIGTISIAARFLEYH